MKDGTAPSTPPTSSLMSFRNMAIVALIFVSGIVAFVFSMCVEDFEKLHVNLDALGLWKPLMASYWCVFIIVAASKVVGKNASKARKAAVVQRMDQYVYEIETSADSSEARPKAVLRYSGLDGEFNRAQRAVNNWQENRDIELCTLMLLSIAVGYYVLIPTIFMFVGRIVFARDYKVAVSKRVPGFVVAQTGNYTAIILLLTFAIKGLTL
ncbi:hypothetical protein TL16_g12092 [Triparma laevis f. inornata]|uniref:Uncharacterized protein n=2 Tax=Triparma laevis TaxID=1534972 RepID=A0A9W7C4T1_9STRA|nr:hypothetical protein TL16_g12092 [Triparma laevis f. inornata]GMI02855.1 hypothetical protein TrLO_g14072 [Triparma laevis f. longispina]